MGSIPVLGHDFLTFLLHFSVVGHQNDTKRLCYRSHYLHLSMCLSLSADILIFVICMMIAVTILLLASVRSGWGVPCEKILPTQQ